MGGTRCCVSYSRMNTFFRVCEGCTAKARCKKLSYHSWFEMETEEQDCQVCGTTSGMYTHIVCLIPEEQDE